MLNHASDYWNKNIAADEFTEFLRGFRDYEKGFLIKEKENLLLDVYSEWLKTKDEKSKLQVIHLALELELLGEHIDVNRLFSCNVEVSSSA